MDEIGQEDVGTQLLRLQYPLGSYSQLSRERSVVLLSERFQNREHPDPDVVIGDFNAVEENPALVYLKREVSVGQDDDNTS